METFRQSRLAFNVETHPDGRSLPCTSSGPTTATPRALGSVDSSFGPGSFYSGDMERGADEEVPVAAREREPVERLADGTL